MSTLKWFVGLDWGSRTHQACLLAPSGEVHAEHAFAHGGAGLAAMADWIQSRAGSPTDQIGVAIETPRGPVVETLLERGFAVHSINPKQLDRFRDRYSPSGAKGRPTRRARTCIRAPHRPAPPAARRTDGPADRRVARVVPHRRGPHPRARAPRQPVAPAALALLPGVRRRRGRRRSALGAGAVETRTVSVGRERRPTRHAAEDPRQAPHPPPRRQGTAHQAQSPRHRRSPERRPTPRKRMRDSSASSLPW